MITLNTSGFNVYRPPKFESGEKANVIEGKHFGKRVIKCGIATGLTHAACAIDGPLTLQRQRAILQLPQPVLIRLSGAVRFMYGQYVVKPFKGDPFFGIGDSGSLVFIADDENTETTGESSNLICLGMAIGMDSLKNGAEEVYVTPIQDIFSALGVKHFYVSESRFKNRATILRDNNEIHQRLLKLR